MYAQASYAVFQAIIDPADMSYGIPFIMVPQLGSMAVSLSACGAVFFNLAKAEIDSLLPAVAPAQIDQLILGTSTRFIGSLSTTERAGVLNALVRIMGKMFIPVYVATAIGFIASAFMRNKREFVPTAAAA